MHTLRLSSVSHSFSTKPILSTVTYEFAQGSSYALTGPSGVGKSTLLHLLAGFEEPTSGAVLFSGMDLSGCDATAKAQILREHIGFIYQVPHLIDELSLAENVMIKGLLAKQPYRLCHQKALDLLSLVGLADQARQQPRSLSGGEQQRVAVVRALFSEPAFILADEPTAHLDDRTSQLLLDLILSYRDQSGIIMVSHNRAIAEQLDHVLRLSDGALLEDLSPTPNSYKERYV